MAVTYSYNKYYKDRPNGRDEMVKEIQNYILKKESSIQSKSDWSDVSVFKPIRLYKAHKAANIIVTRIERGDEGIKQSMEDYLKNFPWIKKSRELFNSSFNNH
ncbi:MAG: hypothetical protein WC688_03295 [Parachlamydiales bacterium]